MILRVKFLLIFLIPLFATISFSGCDDTVTNTNKDNIVDDTTVPHPVPTSDSEEFPPKPPVI